MSVKYIDLIDKTTIATIGDPCEVVSRGVAADAAIFNSAAPPSPAFHMFSKWAIQAKFSDFCFIGRFANDCEDKADDLIVALGAGQCNLHLCIRKCP